MNNFGEDASILLLRLDAFGSSRSRAILVATSIVECSKIISRFYSRHVQPFGSVAVYSG